MEPVGYCFKAGPKGGGATGLALPSREAGIPLRTLQEVQLPSSGKEVVLVLPRAVDQEAESSE